MAALILLFVFVVAIAVVCERMTRRTTVHEWRVVYPDGAKSKLFTRAVAEDYRKIFGGTIVKSP
jgi:hypothetical protein